MNFIGGFLGICIYQGLRRIVPETKLDKRLIAIGTVMGGLCLGMVLFIIFINRGAIISRTDRKSFYRSF